MSIFLHSHKNPLIRATVSRLLYGIINVIGVECLLSNPSFKETRQKIFIMCAKFLLDGNNETRYLVYVSCINMKTFYLIA